MTELEEREQIKAKIIEDIDYLKKNENEIRTALVRIFPNSQDAMSVDIALNTLKMNGVSYLDTGTIEDLKTLYTNIINQFTIVARAFLSDTSNKNSQNKLIESAKFFNEFTTSISIKDASKGTNFQLKHDGGAGLSQEFDKIYLRINNLENKPDDITNTLNKTLENIKNSSKNAEDHISKIQTIYSNAQYLQEGLKSEFDNLKIKSNELLNHNISMILSDQFQEKAQLLKEEADKKLGKISIYNIIAILFSLTLSIIVGSKFAQFFQVHTLLEIIATVSTGSLITFLLITLLLDFLPLLKKEKDVKNTKESESPLKISGFYGAITLMFLINIISWIIYLVAPDIAALITHKSYTQINFWHFMMLKLTINIFLFIHVAFTLSEYTKAKKSYEEFDYKRIMAITLVNNYTRLKNELGLDQDKAFELIRTPFGKIFDNPVHSIYGDKSGDKNIGLDQLEKITSIIEKMKK